MQYSTVVFGVAVILLIPKTALTQSTLFNIPTTDTVAVKKGYFEFDYLPQIPKNEAGGRVQIFIPRIVAGVAPNLEAGANVSNIHVGGDISSTLVLFQPNIKYKFASSASKGLAAATGLIWYTPMNHRDAFDSFGLVYGAFSKKVKTGAYGPRITVGPYGIVAAAEDYFGTKAGAIIGYEQPIHSKVSIVADWFSGVSAFGYFTPGLSLTLPHNSFLYVGYSIGNDSYRNPSNNNRFLFAYYAITFP